MMEQNLTPAYCATELKAVELKLEELTALLDKDKGSLTPSERRKVDNYDSNLAKLEADKAKWFELLQKAQGIVFDLLQKAQGIDY
jgi:hypothetical protein